MVLLSLHLSCRRNIETMKQCSKCRVTKPFTDYHKNRIQPDGFQVWCKLCVKKHQNLKRLEDPEKYKRYQRDWFARHPGYFRHYNRKRPVGKGTSVVVFGED